METRNDADSANHFKYEIADKNVDFEFSRNVLSPSGRTLFRIKQHDGIHFLAINLMTGRTAHFKRVHEEDDQLRGLKWAARMQLNLHPIDDREIFVTFSRTTNHLACILMRFRLDYTAERLIRRGEWPCEPSGHFTATHNGHSDLSHLGTSDVTLVHVSSPRHINDHLHFSVHFFDHKKERFRSAELGFELPHVRLAWSEKSFGQIASVMSNSGNGRLRTFKIDPHHGNWQNHALSRFLDTNFKDLFEFDLLDVQINRIPTHTNLLDCLTASDCPVNTLQTVSLDFDSQWKDDRFYLRLISSSPSRPRALYFALFDVQTLRWERLFAEYSQYLQPRINCRYETTITDEDVLVLCNGDQRYALRTRQLFGIEQESVRVFRMPLRKPDSLKMLGMLKLQRTYGESWTKWRRISNAFREFLK